MNKNSKLWMLPVAGSSLFILSAAAEPAQPPPLERVYSDATNRITASLRFGLNITGKFLNPGGSLNARSAAANGQRTPNGDRYNYDDGYVLTDSATTPAGRLGIGATTAPARSTHQPIPLIFSRTTAAGLPGENSGGDSPYVGSEVT